MAKPNCKGTEWTRHDWCSKGGEGLWYVMRSKGNALSSVVVEKIRSAMSCNGQAPYGMVTEVHCEDQSRNSVDGAAWHCHGMVSNRIAMSSCGIEEMGCVA